MPDNWSGWTVAIYNDVWGTDKIPHSFIIVTDPSGNQKGYGFGPLQPGSLSGTGHVSDTQFKHESGWHTAPMDLSDNQAGRLLNYIKETTAHPPYYDVFGGSHCGVWVENALAAAGVENFSSQPMLDGSGAGDGSTFGDHARQLAQAWTFSPYSRRFLGNDHPDQPQPTSGWGMGGGLALNPANEPGGSLAGMGAAGAAARGRGGFNGGQGSTPRRDPLILDLDGDGLETVAPSAAAPILFDHDGDGVKTGTGWVKPDDGFLVLDRNGNGLIDDGREMFGDATPLQAGGLAVDGFAALADQDTNRNGTIDASDANWSRLRVWRDLNQDGVSQAAELFTLQQLGIASFSVAKTANSQVLPNGNQIADLGTYRRADGTQGTLGDTGRIADINLAQDTFRRTFSDVIPLAPGVDILPDVGASGKLRDLHEAASQSEVVRSLLTQYVQAGTRAAQAPVLDQLLAAWADTAAMAPTLDDRDPAHYAVRYDAFGTVRRADHVVAGGSGGWTTDANGAFVRDANNPDLDAPYRDLVSAWSAKLHVVEAFNGRHFFELPGSTQQGAVTGLSTVAIPGSSTSGLAVAYSQEQITLLEQSYNALRDGVRYALLLQTRFRPLLDSIAVTSSGQGTRWDYDALTQHFRDAIAANPADGVADLIDFSEATGRAFSQLGWRGDQLLEQTIRASPVTPELQAVYTQYNIRVVGQAGFSNSGTEQGDYIVAGDTADTITGNGGNDTLFAGGGNDTLWGGAGNDVLDGGAGNDSLFGGAGNDAYLFGRGSGQDYVNTDYQAVAGEVDTVRLGPDVAPGDLIVRQQSGTDLVLAIDGTSDSLRINDFFANDAAGLAAGVQVQFADGRVWDRARLLAEAFKGTAASDTITGTSGADVISGQAGADRLNGGAGDDVLDGGADGDTLYGGAGNDRLTGGAGNDYQEGGAGNDTYVFGRGDGQDVVVNYDTTAGRLDAIELGPDVAPGDVTLTRATSNGSDSDLRLTINGATDSLQVRWFFQGDATAGYAVDQLRFADGTVWDRARIIAESFKGTPGNDTMLGMNGADMMFGQAGDDTLKGFGGDDQLSGGDGNDTLWGGTGNDRLDGGAGRDTLWGEAGDDVFDGGAGDDTMFGGAGRDTYLFGRGSGQDYANTDFEAVAGQVDTVRLGADVTVSDLIVRQQSGSDLVLAITGTTDTLRVGNFFNNDAAGLAAGVQVQFADGTVWDRARLLAEAFKGTAANDTITGTSGADVIRGQAGADTLNGAAGDDVLDGGAGADTLYGGAGNDRLDGGAGDDPWLEGGAGNDTYVFGRGSGNDLVYNYDKTAGRVDAVELGSDVAPGDLTLTRSGSDLRVAITGTTDLLRVASFFQGDGNDGYRIDQFRFADGTTWDLARIVAEAFKGTPGNDTIEGLSGDDVITGQAGDDTLKGLAGNDTLRGGDGSDTLWGGVGDDVLNGDAGIDTLWGEAGNDVLDGGAGNDSLFGGAGSDTYLFGRGAGQDYANTDYQAVAGEVDTVRLGTDVAVSDLIVRQQSGTDLVLAIAGTSDTLRVNNFFSNDAAGLAAGVQVQFADGTVWDRVRLVAEAFKGTAGNDTITGTSGADVISGQAGADTLNGGAGDDVLDGGADGDTLYGGAGNDRLIGGVGNDYQEGGAGNDTYVFGRGAGQDVVVNYDTTAGRVDAIELGTDVAPGDVVLRRSGDDLVLSINGTTDTLTTRSFFNGDANGGYAVDQLRFADGTAWDRARLIAEAFKGTAGNDTIDGLSGADVMSGQAGDDTLRGLAGNDQLDGGLGNDALYGGDGNDLLDGGADADSLYGGAGNDRLVGGAGNDYLEGGAGDDTYVFGRGAGQDRAVTYDTTPGRMDVVEIAPDVAPDDLVLRRSGSDLVLSIRGTTDTLTALYFFNGATSEFNQIRFADGTAWTHDEIVLRASAPTSQASVLPSEFDTFGQVLDYDVDGFHALPQPVLGNGRPRPAPALESVTRGGWRGLGGLLRPRAQPTGHAPGERLLPAALEVLAAPRATPGDTPGECVPLDLFNAQVDHLVSTMAAFAPSMAAESAPRLYHQDAVQFIVAADVR